MVGYLGSSHAIPTMPYDKVKYQAGEKRGLRHVYVAYERY